jgi:hypothetical protein
MKLFKPLALCAVFALLASPAFGEAREAKPGLIMNETKVVTLFEIKGAEATTNAHCLNLAPAIITTDSAACDSMGINQYKFPYTAKVTNMRIVILTSGNANSTCIFTIEGTAAGGEAVGTANAATSVYNNALTVINVAQNFVITKDDLIGISLTGAGCVDTTPPTFNVILEGQILAR